MKTPFANFFKRIQDKKEAFDNVQAKIRVNRKIKSIMQKHSHKMNRSTK